MAVGDTVGSSNEGLRGVLAALRVTVIILAGLPFVPLGSSVKMDRYELTAHRVQDTLNGVWFLDQVRDDVDAGVVLIGGDPTSHEGRAGDGQRGS